MIDTQIKCDCAFPTHYLPHYYVDDLCELHQELYEEYCRETAPEDRLGVSKWLAKVLN